MDFRSPRWTIFKENMSFDTLTLLLQSNGALLLAVSLDYIHI